MRYLPVGLSVRGRKCVVVGGGAVGTRKVETLLQADAVVYLVSPEISKPLRDLAESGAVNWIREPFDPAHLRGALLAVAATDSPDVNARLVQAARKAGVLICDASSAERSEIIFGALHHREGVTLAVFSGGEDPSRSRTVRDRIADLLSEDLEPEEEC